MTGRSFPFGPYQVQAAINAVHADAARAEDTDWVQILALYDQLLIHAPNPVVTLNRATALAEVEGPEAALVVLQDLNLFEHHLYHATRADLLRRLGRNAMARSAYQTARDLVSNPAERDFLEQRLESMYG